MNSVKFIILLTITVISCSERIYTLEEKLEGKIAKEVVKGKEWLILTPQDTSTMKLPSNDYITYSSFKWYHKSNNFIAGEYFINTQGGYNKSNLVVLNSEGVKIDEIYDSRIGTFVGYYYLSNDDSMVVFTLHDNSNEIFRASASVIVMDLKYRSIINQIKDVSILFSLAMKQPWSPDGSKITYSITKKRQMRVVGEQPQKYTYGTYVYDLEKNRSQLLIPDADLATWSPSSNKIANIIDNNIYLFDYDTNENIIIYRSKKYETIPDIGWLPSGRYLLFKSHRKKFNSMLFYTYNEYLMDMTTSKIYKLGEPYLGFKPYTWKNTE